MAGRSRKPKTEAEATAEAINAEVRGESTDLLDAQEAEVTEVDETQAPAEASDTELFIWDDEGPGETRKALKYDGTVAQVFANPGRWAKLSEVFTSSATAGNIRKQYKDYTDEDGHVLEVKAVPKRAELGAKASYEVFLRAVPGASAEASESGE